MRLDFLPDVARDAGLDIVVPDPNWLNVGNEFMWVSALINHHTVTKPTSSDWAVARLLRDGHSTLKGPLSNATPARDGKVWIISGGRCNHNGYGRYGNQTVSLEYMNDGVGESFTAKQYEAGVILNAAITEHLKMETKRCLEHKESDPKRKTDRYGINPNAFRAHVDLHRLRINGWPKEEKVWEPTKYTVMHTDLENNDQMMIMTFQLDDMGRGWLILDGQEGRPYVPFFQLLDVDPLGPAPAREDYAWPFMKVAKQIGPNNLALLTVMEGAPGGVGALWLRTRL